MSQTSQKEIEDEAYTVIESTNEDGTIDGEIINVPYRDGDNVIIEVLPLTPTANPKEIHFDWPLKESEEYDIVKLCNKKVGGFQSIGELKGEKVKIDINEDNPDDFNIVIDQNKNKRFSNINLSSVMKFIATCTVIGSIGGLATPIILVLLLPWNIYVLSFLQGLSLLFGSFALLIISLYTYEIMDEA